MLGKRALKDEVDDQFEYNLDEEQLSEQASEEEEGDNSISEFEKRRLENIRKNQEILRQLALDAGESLFFKPSSSSTGNNPSSKKKKVSSNNDHKTRTQSTTGAGSTRKDPVVPQRRSLRISGVPVDYSKEPLISLDGLGSATVGHSFSNNAEKYREGPLLLTLESGEDLNRQNKFKDTIKNAADWKLWESTSIVKQKSGKTEENVDDKSDKTILEQDKDLAREFMKLKIKYSDGAVKLVKDRILSCTWHPSPFNLIVTVGDKLGRIGFWHVDSSNKDESESQQKVKLEEKANDDEEEEEEVDYKVYTFKPHDGGISTIQYDSLDASKLYTASYDGTVRFMDINKESFEQIYLCEDREMVCALDQQEHNLYFTKNSGDFIQMDIRNHNRLNVKNISERKVCSVHVCPTKPHYVSTSGLDRSWNIWDLRKFKSPLASFEHGKSCTSAYWSACGKQLVSTSYDDTLLIFEDFLSTGSWDGKPKHRIRHNNQTGRWVTNFRAIYHKNPSKNCVLVGNMQHYIDVYSGQSGRLLHQMYDPNHVTAIPSVLAVHPNSPETLLVSANASGKCLVWY